MRKVVQQIYYMIFANNLRLESVDTAVRGSFEGHYGKRGTFSYGEHFKFWHCLKER